jgi:hypothetical protein
MTTTLDAGGGSDGVFLATTALEEFWDTSGPILFAGEWCRLPERAAVWRALDAEVLPDQWASAAVGGGLLCRAGHPGA